MQCLGGKCMASPQSPGLAAVTSRAISTSCGLAPSARLPGRWQRHPSSPCSRSRCLCSSCSTVSLCSKCWGSPGTWTRMGQDKPHSRQAQGSSRGGTAAGMGHCPRQHSHKSGAQWGCHRHRDAVLVGVGTAQPRGWDSEGDGTATGTWHREGPLLPPGPAPALVPVPSPPRAAAPPAGPGLRDTVGGFGFHSVPFAPSTEMLGLLLAGCRSSAYLKGPA